MELLYHIRILKEYSPKTYYLAKYQETLKSHIKPRLGRIYKGRIKLQLAIL